MTEEDERTEEDGKWKIGQCSVGPETAKTDTKITEGMKIADLYWHAGGKPLAWKKMS